MSEAWLITGGSGFVGKTLLTRLSKSDQRPPVLRVLVRQPSDAPARVEPCVGDLREPLSLHRACEGVDTVIHLAGIAHVGSAASAEARAINLDGSLALLRAAIDAGARRFVFLSSTLSLDDSLHYGRDKRCVEEARIAGRLEHPGIVPVYEVAEAEGQLFFSMQYVSGQTLAQRLADRVSSRYSAGYTISRASTK